MKEKFDVFQLGRKSQQDVKAGLLSVCVCTCAYINCGGSSTADNDNANDKSGLWSDKVDSQC